MTEAKLSLTAMVSLSLIASLVVISNTYLTFVGASKSETMSSYNPLTINPLTDFSQNISTQVLDLKLKTNQTTVIPITIKNTGSQPWVGVHLGPPAFFSFNSSASNPYQTGVVKLGYHWQDIQSPNTIEGGRAKFYGVIHPGQQQTIQAKIVTPPLPGKYILEFSMIQHGVAWFDSQGGKDLAIPVTIKD